MHLNPLTFLIFFFHIPCVSPFDVAQTGNTVIHLDKALARIREYERMKLKAEFNPCDAEHPPANAAESTEGIQSHDANPPLFNICKGPQQLR